MKDPFSSLFRGRIRCVVCHGDLVDLLPIDMMLFFVFWSFRNIILVSGRILILLKPDARGRESCCAHEQIQQNETLFLSLESSFYF